MRQGKRLFTPTFINMSEAKIHAVGQLSELLNRTMVEAMEISTEDYSRKPVLHNILFSSDEVQLIKKKLLKLLTEI